MGGLDRVVTRCVCASADYAHLRLVKVVCMLALGTVTSLELSKPNPVITFDFSRGTNNETLHQYNTSHEMMYIQLLQEKITGHM